jgi:NAD(P)-dependent dehydrogenase (short-subunit alcohol dehydrogenase family)
MVRAASEHGRVDIAVNATGQNLMRPLLSTTPDELRQIAEIQFVAPFLFLQAAVRAMTAGGSIVHLSSVSARNMMRDHAAYAGTKAGFEHVVRLFAWEFGPQGVRINCVSPGLTQTPMTAAVFEQSDLPAFRAANTPLRRLGTPEDVAAAAAWLADPECFLTGEVLQVNGGASLLAAPLPPQS